MNADPSLSGFAETTALFDQLAAETLRRRIWLQVGRLFDGTSDEILRDAHLIFDARRIIFVSRESGETPPAEFVPPGRSAPDAVLPDHFVMPTLIEAHAHLFLDGAPTEFARRAEYLQSPPSEMLARAHLRWPKILRAGIGTVRDAGDKHGVGLALAAEAKDTQGELASTPWIDSPGAAIHHRGRYGSFMGEPLEDHFDPAACVSSRVAKGADRIKLQVSGVINFKVGTVTGEPQMSEREIRAIVEVAKNYDRQTFAHAEGAEGVENAIEGGVDTVERGYFLTEDQLARMRDRQIGWVPTFAPVQAQIDRAAELGWDEAVVDRLKQIIAGHQAMLRRAHALGTPILAGSDAGSGGVPHGVGFLQELGHMEAAGVPAIAVLRAAAGASARLLKFGERIGRITPNHRARLLFTRHDPLETVTNLQKEKTVFFDGATLHDDGAMEVEGL